MKTMKKVISVLMMVCMLASFMTVAAYADSITANGIVERDNKILKEANNAEFHLQAAYTGVDTKELYYICCETDSSLVTLGTAKADYLGSNANDIYVKCGENTTSSPVEAHVTVYLLHKTNNSKVGEQSVKLTFPATAPAPAPVSGAGTITASAESVMVGKTITLDVNVTSGNFKLWEVISKDGKGNGNIDVLKNQHVTFTATSAGKVQINAYDTNNDIFATKEITVTTPRTLELYCNIARIDNGETACFAVSNAQSGETFTWTYTTIPGGLEIVKSTSTSGDLFYVTGGKGNGNVTVTATSANGETGSITVPVNSMGYGDATLSPTNVNWAKGQGNLTFTVTPLLYSAYIDDVCFTGSGNTSKYSYVYSSNNLVINSSYLATLSAGQHVLRVDTVDVNGNNAGTQYAYITVSGTASAAYGDNAHVRGTTSDLYFTANSAISSVTISGTTIDPANYTLSNNGKTITLKANFLNLLNYGSYTMKLGNSNGGTETATFRVVTANYAPATGDESNLAIWIAVMVISGAGAIALIPRRKKEM